MNDPTRQRWLKSLSPDDTIQVFAKARYPGWECYVRSVRIEIYGEFVESALSELQLEQSDNSPLIQNHEQQASRGLSQQSVDKR